MTARVLVVDDLEPNVKLLEAKLRAEYFDVLGAYSGKEAVEKAKAGGKVTVSDWSAEERAKFRTIATSQWVKVAERSPNAKKVYDVLTTYLKTNGLMN